MPGGGTRELVVHHGPLATHLPCNGRLVGVDDVLTGLEFQGLSQFGLVLFGEPAEHVVNGVNLLHVGVGQSSEVVQAVDDTSSVEVFPRLDGGLDGG